MQNPDIKNTIHDLKEVDPSIFDSSWLKQKYPEKFKYTQAKASGFTPDALASSQIQTELKLWRT
jgi:hypothetical protein